MREFMLVDIGIWFMITIMMFVYLIYNIKIITKRRQEFIKVDYKLEPSTSRQTGKSYMYDEALSGSIMDDWITSVNNSSMKRIWKIGFIFSCHALYCCVIWILSEHLENDIMNIFYISLVPVTIVLIGLIIKYIITFFKFINFIKMRCFKIKNSKEIMSELMTL